MKYVERELSGQTPELVPSPNSSIQLPDVASFIVSNSRVSSWRLSQDPHLSPITLTYTPQEVKCDTGVPQDITLPSMTTTLHTVSPLLTLNDVRLHNSKEYYDYCSSLFMALSSRELDDAELKIFEELVGCSSLNDLSRLGLSPSFFASVIDRNMRAASIMLRKIINSPDDALYLNELLCQSPQKPIRLLKSLRIIADVCFAGAILPTNYLNRFIHIAFHICNKVHTYPTQQRVARLICVFLLNFIRVSVVKPTDDIVAEIQSFCVTWIRLKEAGDLFRALRQCTVHTQP